MISSLIAGLLLLPVCLLTAPGDDTGGGPLSFGRMDVALPGLASTQDRPDRVPQLPPLFLAGQLPKPGPGCFRLGADIGPETHSTLPDFSGTSPRSPPADARS